MTQFKDVHPDQLAECHNPTCIPSTAANTMYPRLPLRNTFTPPVPPSIPVPQFQTSASNKFPPSVPSSIPVHQFQSSASNSSAVPESSHNYIPPPSFHTTSTASGGFPASSATAQTLANSRVGASTPAPSSSSLPRSTAAPDTFVKFMKVRQQDTKAARQAAGSFNPAFAQTEADISNPVPRNKRKKPEDPFERLVKLKIKEFTFCGVVIPQTKDVNRARFPVPPPNMHVAFPMLVRYDEAGYVKDIVLTVADTPAEVRMKILLVFSHVQALADEHASSEAPEMMRKRPDRDEIQEFHTQFPRDLLPYLTLVAAIKSGDVEILEALLPTFLFRVIGGGNSNYQEEALELLNRLNVDWPQKILCAKIVGCLTFTNYADNFVSFDQAQEHNIKDIEVTYKPPGPRGGWDYMRILHPAIPTVRANAEFIDQEFNALTREKKHTSPSKEKDIQALLGRLEDAHKFKPGRRLDDEDKPQDYIATGGDMDLRRYS
ncbi:hypothetical protein R3P38DRAFT_3197298 [Favolaschia claudopus]|uniref:DUF6589 domain-containing protein n=1 Tax=Favolaschia claudopus TaxID=2862362 RepID=A0AAW0B478_9AGAR